MDFPSRRTLGLTALLAASLGVAALPVVLPAPEPSSPCRTTRSERGEIHRSLRELARRVGAGGDAGMAWVFEPLRAAIAQDKVRALPALPPAQVPAAEERLAACVGGIGEPLVGALLAQVADPRAGDTVRCVLMRVLAVRWPERLASPLAAVLAREHRLSTFAEAAVQAGRVAARAPGVDLVASLRGAVARARGWGRQYPIVGLELAGAHDESAVVGAALADTDPAVRRHAAMYLGRTGHTSFMARIDRMSRRDPDALTRTVAQDAVGRLIGIALPVELTEVQRRERLDAALVPRLAMFRGAVHE